MNKFDNPQVSRRKFLHICGSLIAGGSLLGLSGTLLHKRLTASGQSQAEDKDRTSTSRCDKALAEKTACAGCKVDCPLRKGVSI